MRKFFTVSRLVLGATCGSLLVAAGIGCGGDGMTMDPNNNMMMMPMPSKCTADKVMGSSSKYATDSLKVPGTTGSKTYAYDVDGDGTSENQLRNLLNIVSSAGLNIQDPINMAVANGDAVILTEVKAADLMKTDCASLTFALAKAPAMGEAKPKFDGTDTFKIGDVMGVKVLGVINNGKLTTTASKEQTGAEEQKIELKLPLTAGMTLPLALRGVHFEGTFTVENGVPKIKDGAIHGVISKKDIDTKIVPTVATIITDMIHKDPMGSTTKTIVGLFENMSVPVTKMKCDNTPMKCCAKNPATCEILPEEVLASPIGGVLAADVEVLDDATDTWKPVPKGKNPDAMSVGLGFSSVKATF